MRTDKNDHNQKIDGFGLSFRVDLKHGQLDRIPDEEFLKRHFKKWVGYDLNMENPQIDNKKLRRLRCMTVSRYP